MLVTVFSAIERGNVITVALAGFLAVLIIWNLVNSEERLAQVRVKNKIQVFIIPLLIMFIYIMIDRFFE
jgi:hypothetical protein